jgi:hypothetical protein
MYKKEKKGWLKHLDFMVLDLIVFQLCYIASYWILRGISNPYSIVLYRYQGIVYVLCQLIVVLFTESYKNVLRRGTAAEIISTFRYVATVELLNLVYLFSVHQIYMISRLLTGITAVLFFFASFFVRQANKKRVLRMRKDSKGQRSLMVITSSLLVDEVIRNLSDNSFHDYFISGIILMDQASADEKEMNGIPVLGRGENILFYIGRHWVDEVFLYQPENLPYPTEMVDSLLNMGITVHYCISALNENRWGTQEVEKIGNYKVLTNSLRIVSIRELAFKRAVDILGGIVGMDKVTGTLSQNQVETMPGMTSMNDAMGNTLSMEQLQALTDTAAVAEGPTGMEAVLGTLGSLNYTQLIVSFLLFFLFGYLLYASLFAAIGSAVENEADTQQLQIPVTVPLLLGFFIAFYAFRAPESTIVWWGSMIPFTSPIVMLARLPFGVPMWELILSIGLLILTFFACAWASAKIYKVGILMYGKKSTFKDLWKWLKQK